MLTVAQEMRVREGFLQIKLSLFFCTGRTGVKATLCTPTVKMPKRNYNINYLSTSSVA